MLFCRPSTAILLLARLRIFLFSLLRPTLTLKIPPFLPKFEFLPPPGGTSKAPPISLKFCTRHFFMHVPLFVTSHLDFEKKSQKRYTLLYNAFLLFIDEHILKCIQKHTINHGKIDESNFDLHFDELESFIGLQLARGVLVRRNTPIKQLWSKDWGQPIFRNTMIRDTYAKIMKHLSFDDFQRRKQRRETDKFCLISEVWNSFIENCKKYYVPNFAWLLTNNFLLAKLDASLFSTWKQAGQIWYKVLAIGWCADKN